MPERAQSSGSPVEKVIAWLLVLAASVATWTLLKITLLALFLLSGYLLLLTRIPKAVRRERKFRAARQKRLGSDYVEESRSEINKEALALCLVSALFLAVGVALYPYLSEADGGVTAPELLAALYVVHSALMVVLGVLQLITGRRIAGRAWETGEFLSK